MAVAHLADAGTGSDSLRARRSQHEVTAIQKVLDRRFNTPLTSSAGRLFDAVAAIAGVRDRVSYEGQAAIELEGLATTAPPGPPYPFVLSERHEGAAPVCVIDTRPLIRAVASDATAGVTAAKIARRFHSSLVEIIASVCARLRDETGLSAVVLSGGVFLNALLTSEVCARLVRDGFRAYRHRLVPPNDGGLALGQVAVAATQTPEP
jgi:hydrogenase maturation protein HypF